jgi:hypothetical protein
MTLRIFILTHAECFLIMLMLSEERKDGHVPPENLEDFVVRLDLLNACHVTGGTGGCVKGGPLIDPESGGRVFSQCARVPLPRKFGVLLNWE